MGHGNRVIETVSSST